MVGENGEGGVLEFVGDCFEDSLLFHEVVHVDCWEGSSSSSEVRGVVECCGRHYRYCWC